MTINSPTSGAVTDGAETEEPLEQRLAQLLRERGEKDPEVRRLLNSWEDEQERLVEASADYHLAQIELNLRRGRLYFAAGYKEDARANFESARTQAWNEGREELFRSIMEEMDKLGL